jgi:hypothetical protein
MTTPWEHPDWYDLHDDSSVAGVERESEHYREFVLALPPLSRHDHLVDVGAGTGKLAVLVATAYPELGRLSLVEPNVHKLDKAMARTAALLGSERVVRFDHGVGDGRSTPVHGASLAIVGSVLMPIMLSRGGSLDEGCTWLARALLEVRSTLLPGAWMYNLETCAMPWQELATEAPVRRLTLPELVEQVSLAGFEAPECLYRFRDRVVLRARAPG